MQNPGGAGGQRRRVLACGHTVPPRLDTVHGDTLIDEERVEQAHGI